MRFFILLLPILLFSSCEKKQENSDPKNFWIFILAGQSNMAGRGQVEPQDTITHPRILVLDTTGQWILAKEPLHPYEPRLQGLDCGLSFGKSLIKNLPDSITIGLIPCAVGGSSVEQWLGDSLHRGVKLFSNFEAKVLKAQKSGVIKGILWHQGESNANPRGIVDYKNNLDALFTRFRLTATNKDLPILAGGLGAFIVKREENGTFVDSINWSIKNLADSDPAILFVKTEDLTDKGDSLHFNSASLRELGKRYAENYLGLAEKSPVH